MTLSYWERQHWFTNVDFTIVGSGIVGLQTALHLREQYRDARILVLERSTLPEGASTKNAGFACFGSVTELLSDLQTHSEQEVVELVQKRWEGLQVLKSTVGSEAIQFESLGGYELFLEEEHEIYQTALSKLEYINELLYPLFRQNVFSIVENQFGFQRVQNRLLFNALEGQIDPGLMMQALLRKAHQKGILVLNGITVENYVEHSQGVEVQTNGTTFMTQKLLVTTNGFAWKLLPLEVQPARAQVLITSPIADLKTRGTFHMDAGYYYFRNVGNRVLFGGGRNLDFAGETTTQLETTEQIQHQLEHYLKTVILPEHEVVIDHRWSGIMGVGNQKKPIVKALTNRVYCGVRMGGMGVALGSLVGKELADLTT